MASKKTVYHTKREPGQVGKMFDRISGSYDRLNRVISLGGDLRWRRMASEEIAGIRTRRILDVCSGTADMAIVLSKTIEGHPFIDGVDISADALAYGEMKVKKAGLERNIRLRKADAESLPFDDSVFDAITIAFGLRNLKDRDRALREFLRVLRPGGRLVCLEFSHPRNRALNRLFITYMRHFVPVIARMFGADKSAYKYLAETVAAFPNAADLSRMMRDSGFQNTRYKQMFLGSVAIHAADKA